tara:strand:- start:6004 stop:6402 length:399 start_codon:yes stop_codon:yes gene_type:complete
MSTLSSYLIHVYTGEDYDVDAYDKAAGRLLSLFTDLLSHRGNVETLTHHADIESCASEVEISMEPTPEGRELVGKAVIDISAQSKVKFDKAKLSKMIKAHSASGDWPHLKVAKNAVTDWASLVPEKEVLSNE